jgi:hypothetical protein
MMSSHLGLMAMFAICVGAVFGTLMRETPRDQIRLAGRIAGGLVLGAYAAGWILYWVFR